MELKRADGTELVCYPCADRIGFARLTTMAFNGIDLRPMRDEIMAKIALGTVDAGEGLDLSLIAQLLGDKQMGLAVQDEVLAFHQLFRSPCSLEKPKLRVLALAAAMDMGGNTPIEFLLEHSGIELQTLYVVDGIELPTPLPEHDVAIVIASDSEECRQALRKIESAASRWPRPLLNPPHLVGNLDRDKLHRLLHGIEGLDIPATEAASRAQLSGSGRYIGFIGRYRRRPRVSNHYPAARLACRHRPCEDRRPQRARPLPGGAAGSGILRLPLRRLRQC